MSRRRFTKQWHALTPRQKAKHERGICTEKHCRRENEPQRLKCCTCRSAHYAERNPIRIKFLNVKKSALRRGIGWSLTWKQFEPIAKAAGYDTFTNLLDASTLSVNRIREWEGYHVGNIEIIPLGKNSELAAAYRAEMRAQFVPYFQKAA